MILGLTANAWVTIIVLVILVYLNARTRIAPEFLSLGALAVLLLTGAINEQQLLSGFGSESVIVTGAQCIVIVALLQSGALAWVVKHVLKRPSTHLKSLLRLMFPAAMLSSVMEDLTVTTAFVSIIHSWAKKIKIAPSKLLIPAAYATLMGGTLTIIGTPPNIIISSLYAERTGEHLGLLSITIPAFICMLVGFAAIILFRNKLPERKSPEEEFASTGDYTVELLVPTENPAVGQTIEEAGLNNVPGGRLIEIVRFDAEVISPVPADEFILGGDHLVYAGEVDEILALKRSKGLVNANKHVFSVEEVDLDRKLRTATVKYNGCLDGVKMQDTNFEDENNMILVAVSRMGDRIKKSPREIELKAGDTLLLECPPGSANDDDTLSRDLLFFDSNDTVVIGKKSAVSGIVMLLMVLSVCFNILSLLEATILAATAMLLLRCCSPERAVKGMEWEILIMIACSVVFGKAIEANGITDVLAKGALAISNGSPLIMLLVLCISAMVLTEFFSNAVTAAIFFPIAFDSAMAIGSDPLPFIMATMLAVSTSYATPFGSPVNLEIYGAGGYRFADFYRFGLPIKLIMLVAIMIVVPLFYGL